MRRNSVLEELRVSRLAVIQEGRNLLYGILDVSDVKIEIKWIKRKEKFCVVFIKVTVK